MSFTHQVLNSGSSSFNHSNNYDHNNIEYTHKNESLKSSRTDNFHPIDSWPNSYQSFHPEYCRNHLHMNNLDDNCSKSYDSSIFNEGANVINLNHNLITTDSSFMQDSTDLQWCLEPVYQNYSQNTPRSVFEYELMNQTSYEQQLSDCNSHSNTSELARKYLFQNDTYDLLSRDLDANLAEVDMETFNRIHVNTVLSGIKSKFSNSINEEIQPEDSQSTDNSLILDSFISGIGEDSKELRSFNSQADVKNQVLISTREKIEIDNSKSQSELLEAKNLNEGGESFALSIDSLDISCFEENFNEMVNRCRNDDKTKYMITFEESCNSFINESVFNNLKPDLKNDHTKYEVKNLTNLEDKNSKVLKTHHQNKLNEKELLTKSEYSVTSKQNEMLSTDKYSKSKSSSKINLNELNSSKQSQSVPNIMQILSKSAISDSKMYSRLFATNYLYQSNQCIPLYNLNSSFANSDSSNAPRNLIKLFIQNKVSSSSSGGQISNISFESATNSSVSTPTQTYINNINQISQNINNNNNNNNINNNNLFNLMGIAKELNAITNCTYEDESQTKRAIMSTEPNLKLPFNRQIQTSPIKEEDEHLTESSAPVFEKKKYTNFQETCVIRQMESSLQDKIKSKDNTSTCPRSVSCEEFRDNRNIQRQALLCKQDSLKNTVSNTTKVTSPRAAPNSKDCSISSGYLSGCYSQSDWNKKNANKLRRNISSQVPTAYEDKQVQTSILMTQPFHPTHNLSQDPFNNKCCNNATCNTSPVCSISKNSANAPIYIYYPNYSLPDLKFVNNLTTLNAHNSVHLSPTKYRLHTFDSIKLTKQPCAKIGKPNFSKKARPKSCGDFENLSRENFKHIRDWDSLSTLLPIEFQNLIKNLKNDNSNKPTETKTADNTPTCSVPKTGFGFKENLDKVELRPKLKKHNSLDTDDNACRPSSLNYCTNNTSQTCNNKRFSLQEPATLSDDYLNNNNVPCVSHLRKMTKSITMNMPIVYPCQQQIQHSNYCHHNSSLYSCCAHNSSNGLHHFVPSVNSCSNLCSFTSNPHCCSPQTFNEYLHLGYKMASPLKPCNPITEQDEDVELDLDLMANLVDSNNEIDFDKLLNLRKKKEEKQGKLNLVNKNSKPLKNVKKESFKDLQNHWEKIAKVPKLSPVKKQLSVSKVNTAKTKVNSTRSRSKSPVKSNKEVIILTKKEVKQQVPIKSLNKSKKSECTPVSLPKAAVRPSSFNTQFKSMIPIARNLKSPPISKQ